MGQRCRPTCNPCLIGMGLDGEIITTSFLGSGSVVNVFLDPYSEYGSGPRYNMLNTVLCNPQFFNNSTVVIKNYVKYQTRQRKRLDPDPFSDFLLGLDLLKSRIRIRNTDYPSFYSVSGVPVPTVNHAFATGVANFFCWILSFFDRSGSFAHVRYLVNSVPLLLCHRLT